MMNEPRIEIINHRADGTKGMVVAHVSDLHIGRKLRPVHRRAARILNRRNPDVIVITGDSTGHRKSLPALGEWLTALEAAPHRIYAVMGNWEYARLGDTEAIRRLYAEHGATLLVNEQVDIVFQGGTMRITGLDDLLLGRPDYTLPGRGGAAAVEIVLAHEPMMAEALADRIGGAIILSGHTHGGQITFFGRALYTPKGSGPYVAGRYTVGTNRLYVSRGIGTSTVRLRIKALPDIRFLPMDLQTEVSNRRDRL